MKIKDKNSIPNPLVLVNSNEEKTETGFGRGLEGLPWLKVERFQEKRR